MGQGKTLRGLPTGDNVVLENFVRVKEKPSKPKYAPPKAYVNMDVNWHIAADEIGQPSPAKCLAVNGETIDIVAFTKDGIRYIRGVRHVNDPRAVNISRNIQNKSGAWSAAEREDMQLLHIAIQGLRVAEDRIQVLEESIAAILGKEVDEWRKEVSGFTGLGAAGKPSDHNKDGDVDEEEVDAEDDDQPIPYSK